MAISSSRAKVSEPPGALRRSRRQRVLAGVCGGIAERFAWRPWIVRVMFVVGSFIPILPGFLVYLLMWLVVPLED
jgi:phage shock protein C